MKLVRIGLSVASIALLAAGFVASVYAAITHQAAEYTAKIDQPPVRYAALFLLLAAIVLCSIPEPGPEPS